MNITTIGAGYVGLVSSACFAEFGFTVTCYDICQDKIHSLQQGVIPIHEPGLSDLIKTGISKNRLSFTTELKAALTNADIVILAVGTPCDDSGKTNLSFLHSAIDSITENLGKQKIILLTKSTVPIGTNRELSKKINSSNIKVVSNPEFLREGAAINDFMRPNRVIIGLEDINDIETKKILDKLYRPLYLFNTPVLYTNLETAETIKYAANAFLATKITFINEMADLCEKVNADVQTLATGMGMDNRIGSKFLHPGPGFGGSCFPKDIKALLNTAQNHKVDLSIVNSTMTANENRKVAMVDKILNICKTPSKVAILGLSFKPNTDDIRESPALTIISELLKLNYKISTYDPEAINNAKTYFKNEPEITWCQDLYEASIDAKVLVIVTEWNEFRSMDIKKLKSCLNKDNPTILDLRNIYTPNEITSLAINYISIGRN